MSTKLPTSNPAAVVRVIREVRGHRVILDVDAAALYGVPTKALVQAVKRNAARFPAGFMFRLTSQEAAEVNRSQIVTGSQKHRPGLPRPSKVTVCDLGARASPAVSRNLKSPGKRPGYCSFVQSVSGSSLKMPTDDSGLSNLALSPTTSVMSLSAWRCSRATSWTRAASTAAIRSL